MPRSEEQLVAACLAKEPGALEELLERFSDPIRAAARQAIHSQISPICAEPDDLYQEFCAELARNPRRLLGSFKAEYPLDSWLFCIAVRVCQKKLRSKRFRWPEHTMQFEYPGGPNAVPDWHDPAAPAPIPTAPLLEALNEESRFIIEARFGLKPFDQVWSMAEIAAHFGWSPSNAYYHLHRALDELRALAQWVQNE
jgi:DNA-directed RNA polymerase specialized sigma24 family protein